jgi:hypothetical protein
MNRLCTICGITFDQHECCGAVAADKVEELLAERDRLRDRIVELEREVSSLANDKARLLDDRQPFIELVTEGRRKAEAERDRLRDIIEGALIDVSEIRKEVTALKAERDRLRDALERIDQWSEQWSRAYPLDIFPEPDFSQVRAALEVFGITLDAVSASNTRHIVEGVGKIARDALKGE